MKPKSTLGHSSNSDLAALPDLFLLNPQNRAFVDGKAAHIDGDWSIWGLIFGIPLVIIAIFMTQSWSTINALRTSGVDIEGSFTKYWETDDEGTDYVIAYTFVVDGQEFSSQQDVQLQTYENADVSLPIEIIYLPGDPHISTLSIEPEQPTMQAFLTVTAVILALGLAVAAIRVRKRIRRLSQGQLLQGKVDGWLLQETNGGEDPDYFKCFVDYTFYSPNGHQYSSRAAAKLTVSDPKEFKLHFTQPPLAVLYVNDELYQVL